MTEKDLCEPPPEKGDYIAIFRFNGSRHHEWEIGQVYFCGSKFHCAVSGYDSKQVQVKAWLPMPKMEDFKCS